MNANRSVRYGSVSRQAPMPLSQGIIKRIELLSEWSHGIVRYDAVLGNSADSDPRSDVQTSEG
jgi:hypothetical protein